ncbi:ABC transporter ATP-binding protein [Peptoniphilus equinus]|uniref:ABC transporter ATP-binding protein n=2 Tax=Peptoniphilus equinus TaxID=3016343 RepID=A0ABY7QXW2_9FIRM|nr:ABC transporter ATP-binding protein [Peptoniphilus equinus]
MRRHSGPRGGKLNTKENKEAFKRLLSMLLERGGIKFIGIIFLTLIAAGVQVLQALYIRLLVDQIIIPQMESGNFDITPLFRLVLLFGLIFAAGAMSTLISARIMINIAESIIRDLRKEMFAHMQTLPIAYFDTTPHGDLMSRFTNDTQVLEQMLTNALPSFFSSIITLTVIIISMILSSAILFGVVIVTVFALIFAMRFIGGKSAVFFSAQQQSLGTTNGYIEELIEGQKVVKVFSREAQVIDKFKELNDALAHNTMMANRYSLFLMPIIFNIGNLQFAFIATIGGLLTATGATGLSVGGLVGFLQLSRSFSGPINQLSQQMNQVISALAGAKRIFELLDTPSEVDNGVYELARVCDDGTGGITECTECTSRWAWKNPETGELIELRGDIRFENVDFSYDGVHPVLKNISLYAKPGQKIAFVGETGAGKTTITNLINRFYDVDRGTITFDGIDVKDIKKHHLRSSLGMVLQDTHLFTGTVKYNLKYAKDDATDDEVIEAAKKTQSHGFIKNLAKGYNTEISGTASDLSQGQSQLLSIGRAELYNPPVLILDEATSSIDSHTERLVQESMDEIMKGRTTFVIAHRLSTVKNADAIMVLSRGEIIERGDHDDLLAQRGVYYRLYTGGFDDEE